MTNKKEISAGIIIIGNEVLSGRTKDINTSALAKWLNTLGIKVKEVRIVPDDEIAIIHTVNFLRVRFNFQKEKNNRLALEREFIDTELKNKELELLSTATYIEQRNNNLKNLHIYQKDIS